MSKTLIIAEKPSVAADLARVLGKELGKMKRDEAGECYSNDSLIVTSAVGHLVEQKKPQTEDGKSLPWKMNCLPVLPDLAPAECKTAFCQTKGGSVGQLNNLLLDLRHMDA